MGVPCNCLAGALPHTRYALLTGIYIQSSPLCRVKVVAAAVGGLETLFSISGMLQGVFDCTGEYGEGGRGDDNSSSTYLARSVTPLLDSRGSGCKLSSICVVYSSSGDTFIEIVEQTAQS